MKILFLVSFVLFGNLCQSISAEEQVIRNDTASNNKLYQDAKRMFVRLMKKKIVNQNEYLKYCDLSTSIEEAKQSALQEFDSKRLNDDNIAKEYREKLKQDLNYFQLSLDKLWIFYSEGLHQYSILMRRNSSDESNINRTELYEIHKKVKIEAIEKFQKNTDSNSVFKLSVQRRLENTIEEEFSRMKEQNDRIFTEMALLHNERSIAEIIESFDDQMVTEMPDIYFYNPFEYAIKRAMKDFDATKLGDENLSNSFREKLSKALRKISERLLRLAVRTGNANAVNYLVKMGFNVNAIDRKELTLLHGAAAGGYEKVVEALLKEKADVNAKEFYGWTPFHKASDNGHLKIIKMLIENGANVNARTERNKTGLHLAVQNGHEKVAEFLIDIGIDVNSRDENGLTPIFLPIYSSLDMIDREHIILTLIKKGANVNLQDDRGRVPIHNVANLGYNNIFEILVQNGANTTIKDMYGSTTLMLAARQGHEKIIDFLIHNGSDVNAKDNDEQTPLHYATQNGSKTVVEILLKNGADVNAKDNMGWTVLHKVVRAIQESNQEGVAELLIQHGANVNAEDNRGERPLQTAAFYGREKLVEIFLENGAEVNARDNQNGTALHWAAYYGYKGVVQILLKNGADKTIQNNLGATPVEVNRKVFESNPKEN